MKNLFFIILHYNNKNETEACISSILNQEKTDSKINVILIDNNSPNGSGKELQKEYQKNPNIQTIILDKNLGFAKANNVGYALAKEQKADLIIVSNNDVSFNSDFIKILLQTSESESSYSLICPDIINLENYHQNPIRIDPMSKKTTIKNILHRQLILILLNIPFLNKKIQEKETKREQTWLKNYYSTKKQYKKLKGFFVPFGACVIYTKKWIKKESLAFTNNNFMYMEEEHLAKYCKKSNHKMLYESNIKLRHLDGISIKNQSASNINKMKKRYYYQKQAMIQYLWSK